MHYPRLNELYRLRVAAWDEQDRARQGRDLSRLRAALARDAGIDREIGALVNIMVTRAPGGRS